jgi:hypothetical protein
MFVRVSIVRRVRGRESLNLDCSVGQRQAIVAERIGTRRYVRESETTIGTGDGERLR